MAGFVPYTGRCEIPRDFAKSVTTATLTVDVAGSFVRSIEPADGCEPTVTETTVYSGHLEEVWTRAPYRDHDFPDGKFLLAEVVCDRDFRFLFRPDPNGSNHDPVVITVDRDEQTQIIFPHNVCSPAVHTSDDVDVDISVAVSGNGDGTSDLILGAGMFAATVTFASLTRQGILNGHSRSFTYTAPDGTGSVTFDFELTFA